VIVGSVSGGVAGAVVLYEAGLGLGISLGPLLGGERCRGRPAGNAQR
jgi:ACDE family multidrug resistance protein